MLTAVSIDEDEDIFSFIGHELEGARVIPRVIDGVIASGLGATVTAGLSYIKDSVELRARRRRAVDPMGPRRESVGDLRRRTSGRAARVFKVKAVRCVALHATHALVGNDRPWRAATRHAVTSAVDAKLGAILHSVIAGGCCTEVILTDVTLTVGGLSTSLTCRARVACTATVQTALLTITDPVVAAWRLTLGAITDLTQAVALNLAASSRSAGITLPSAVHVGLESITNSIVTSRFATDPLTADLRTAVLRSVTSLADSARWAVPATIFVGLCAIEHAIVARGCDALSQLTHDARTVISRLTRSPGSAGRADIAAAIDIGLCAISDTIATGRRLTRTRQTVPRLAVGICRTPRTISTRCAVTTAVDVRLRTITNLIVTLRRSAVRFNTALIEAVGVVNAMRAVDTRRTQAAAVYVRLNTIKHTVVAGDRLTGSSLTHSTQTISAHSAGEAVCARVARPSAIHGGLAAILQPITTVRFEALTIAAPPTSCAISRLFALRGRLNAAPQLADLSSPAIGVPYTLRGWLLASTVDTALAIITLWIRDALRGRVFTLACPTDPSRATGEIIDALQRRRVDLWRRVGTRRRIGSWSRVGLRRGVERRRSVDHRSVDHRSRVNRDGRVLQRAGVQSRPRIAGCVLSDIGVHFRPCVCAHAQIRA